MLKVLFVTDNFFPQNNPQAILLRNLLLELKNSKTFELHLVTTNKNAQIIKNIKYFFINYNINKFYSYLDRLPLLNKFSFFKLKYSNQLKALEKYILNNNIDIIMSFSNPYILNVINYFLSKHLNLIHVIHYSDPIVNTIYKKYFFFKFTNFFLKVLQKKILEESSHIVFNNYQMANFVLASCKKKYLKKISVIPHSYNRRDFNVSYKKKNNNIVVSYFGSMNKIRDPFFLINIILNLKKKNKKLNNYIFNFYGNLDRSITNKVILRKKILNLNKIFFFESTSYLKSISNMKKSDVLINFDAKGEESIYLTSKIINYLPIKKLVINLTQLNSPNYQLGKEANFFFIDINSYESNIESKFYDAITSFKKFKPNLLLIKKFESKQIANMWQKLFISI